MRNLLVAYGLLCAGCAAIEKQSDGKSLVLESKWARSTYQSDYMAFRYLNRTTPVIYDDLVIGSNAFDGLVAYRDSSGNPVWKKLVPHGVEGGLVLDGGRLYFSSSGAKFYCLEARTGREIWVFDFKSEGLAKAALDDETVYFVDGKNVLFALDRATGKQKWIYNRKDSAGLSIRGASQPLISGNMIYVGFGDGSVVALEKSNGKLKWEKEINDNKRFKDVDAQPILEGGILYVPGFDASLVALKIEDGSVVWKYDDGGFDSVTIKDKTIYYSTSTGKLVALDLATGKKIWEYIVADGYATKVVWYKGLLIFGESSGPFVVLDASNGRLVKKFTAVRGVASPVALREDSGEVYFISRDANLFKLQLAWKRNQDYWPWELRR